MRLDLVPLEAMHDCESCHSSVASYAVTFENDNTTYKVCWSCLSESVRTVYAARAAERGL